LGEIMDEKSIATCIAIEIKKAGELCHPPSNFVFLNKADSPEKISLGQKIAELLQTNKDIHRIIIIVYTLLQTCFCLNK